MTARDKHEDDDGSEGAGDLEKWEAPAETDARGLVRTAGDAVRLDRERVEESVAVAATVAAKFPQFLPLATSPVTARPPTRRPSIRERIAGLIQEAAELTRSNPAELEEILLQHGDLEEVVSSLTTREQSARQRVQKAKVLQSVVRLVSRFPDLFEHDQIEQVPHPYSRRFVDERLERLESIARVARIDLGAPDQPSSPPPGEAAEVTRQFEEHRRTLRTRSEVAVRRFETAKAIHERLADSGWLFEESEPVFRPHPLSRKSLDTLLQAALESADEAKEVLRCIQVERDAIGLNRGISSEAQHKARVFLDLGAELMVYMGRSWAAGGGTADDHARVAGMSWNEVRDSLRKPEIGQIADLACRLVNSAFPKVAQISPESLRASRDA